MTKRIEITDVITHKLWGVSNKRVYFNIYDDTRLVHANDLDISDSEGLDFAKRYIVDLVKVLWDARV